MKLRPMTMQDADKMLEWKNYPETRQFAIHSHFIIKRENHIKWLSKNLQYFKVINDRQGAIRVQNKEVSIWVDRAFRENGLATEAVKKVSKHGMTAKIVDGNVSSMRCFIKCGYIPVSHEYNYYILQCQK